MNINSILFHSSSLLYQQESSKLFVCKKNYISSLFSVKRKLKNESKDGQTVNQIVNGNKSLKGPKKGLTN